MVRKIMALVITVAFIATSAPLFAAEKGKASPSPSQKAYEHANEMAKFKRTEGLKKDKDAIRAQKEAEKAKRQAEKEALKAQKEAEKAKRQAEKEARKAQQEAEKAARKAQKKDWKR